MAFSFLPKEDQYFSLFSEMSTKLKEGAAVLVEMMQSSDENYDAMSKKLKHIEHECDELSHRITTKLNRSFITPFDREDIYTLSMALLCLHLSHGVSSLFQSLGLKNKYYGRHIDRFAKAAALIIFLGNCSIPVAILFKFVN